MDEKEKRSERIIEVVAEYSIKAIPCRKCGRALFSKRSMQKGTGPGCSNKFGSRKAIEQLESAGQLRLFEEEKIK